MWGGAGWGQRDGAERTELPSSGWAGGGEVGARLERGGGGWDSVGGHPGTCAVGLGSQCSRSPFG